MEDIESEVNTDIQEQACTSRQTLWGFQQEAWHDSCLQKCVVLGNICAVILSITSENIAKICQDSLAAVEDFSSHPYPLSGDHTEKIAKFCIYLINGILAENLFSWQDAMYLRFYFQTSLLGSMKKLSVTFSKAFREFAEINPEVKSSSDEPIFNLVPVLGSGRSATSMDAVLTCEVLAQKPSSS